MYECTCRCKCQWKRSHGPCQWAHITHSTVLGLTLAIRKNIGKCCSQSCQNHVACTNWDILGILHICITVFHQCMAVSHIYMEHYFTYIHWSDITKYVYSTLYCRSIAPFATQIQFMYSRYYLSLWSVYHTYTYSLHTFGLSIIYV